MIDQNTLSRFGFLADLPASILTDIAAASQLLSFEPSTVIFHAGEKAETLYGLIQGEVDLSLVVMDKSLKAEVEFEEAVRVQFLEKASRISVDTARPGQVFGWSALTGRGLRTVTATCSLPTRVAAIPAQSVIAMCAKDPALGYELMKRLVGIIAKRLDNRNKRLIETWVEAFGVSKVVP
jgi:CRP/FNR family cyclic AMP-dependent transcriptional regulator